MGDVKFLPVAEQVLKEIDGFLDAGGYRPSDDSFLGEKKSSDVPADLRSRRLKLLERFEQEEQTLEPSGDRRTDRRFQWVLISFLVTSLSIIAIVF